MLCTAIAVAMKFKEASLNFRLCCRLNCIVLALVLSGLLVCLPERGHATGLDCPATRSAAAVPTLFSDLQVKLVSSGNTVDVTNEINDLINKLQIAKPNISYAELSDVMIAAYCQVLANMGSLTVAEKWKRIRQFDSILRQQLAARTLQPGTLIIANVPLPPAVYRELRSQAAKSGQSPAQYMAAILSRAAGN